MAHQGDSNNPARADAPAIYDIPLDGVIDDNIGLWLTLCALNIPLDRAKDLVIEYKEKGKHDKEIEFLASIKMIKDKNLSVRLSEISFQSIKKCLIGNWGINLVKDTLDQENIKLIINNNNINPKNLSDAEMHALIRFKELLVSNGHVEESVLLDVKYSCAHVKYICLREHYSNGNKCPSIEKDQGTKLEDQGTELELQGTELEYHGTKLKDQGTQLKDQGTKLKDQGIKLKDQGTKLKDQGAKLKDQGIKLEGQGTKLEDQGSKLKDQGTKLKDQGTKLEDQGTKVEDQGTKLKDQGAKLKDQGTKLKDQGTKLEDQGTQLEDQGTKLKEQGTKLEDESTKLEDQGTELKDQGIKLKKKEKDYIIPFKLLHRVCENVGYNLHSAVHFTKHFVQSCNIQSLEVRVNREDKNRQINKFLKVNTNRGDLVEDMIKQFKQSIRKEVLKSMDEDEYRHIIKYQDGIANLNKLFQIQDEVSDLLAKMSDINIQQ